MPIYQKTMYIKTNNHKFHYYQYGTKGTKYFFDPQNKKSKLTAYSRALNQARAINANKYK